MFKDEIYHPSDVIIEKIDKIVMTNMCKMNRDSSGINTFIPMKNTLANIIEELSDLYDEMDN